MPSNVKFLTVHEADSGKAFHVNPAHIVQFSRADVIDVPTVIVLSTGETLKVSEAPSVIATLAAGQNIRF